MTWDVAERLAMIWLQVMGGAFAIRWCIGKWIEWVAKRHKKAKEQEVLVKGGMPGDAPNEEPLEVYTHDAHTLTTMLEAIGREGVWGDVNHGIVDKKSAFIVKLRNEKELERYRVFVAKARVTHKLVKTCPLTKGGVYVEVKE